MTKPTAKPGGAGLAIAWLKAPRASEYVVTIKAGTEVLLRTLTKKPKLLYTGAPPRKLTIQITSRDRFGRDGRTTSLTSGSG